MAMLPCFLWVAVLAASAVRCAPHGGNNATYDYIGKFELTSFEGLLETTGTN